jgi:hypothetical protein
MAQLAQPRDQIIRYMQWSLGVARGQLAADVTFRDSKDR